VSPDTSHAGKRSLQEIINEASVQDLKDALAKRATLERDRKQFRCVLKELVDMTREV